MRVELNQQKKGLPAFVLAPHELNRAVGGLVVDRFHPLLGQGAGVLDGLLPDFAEARIAR